MVPGFELTGKGKRVAGSKFIVTRNVSREIRRALRPGFEWRPYVLRAYFDSQMLLAENRVKSLRHIKLLDKGHSGDVEEARYTTRKGCLPDQMIEDMRKRFEASGVSNLQL